MLEDQANHTQSVKRRSLSDLLFLLALLPVILGSLICFGQLALLINVRNLPANTASLLTVEYRPWEYDLIPALNLPGLLNDIARDDRASGVVTTPAPIITGTYWVVPTATAQAVSEETDTPINVPPTATEEPAEPPTPKPTSTRGITATNRPSATVTLRPTANNTPTPTATRTPTQRPIVLTNTPTDQPEPTRTKTKPPTPTRTNTKAPPPTSTNTKAPPPTSTNTSAPTKTNTPRIVTPTPRPVIPTKTHTPKPTLPKPPSPTPVTPTPVTPTPVTPTPVTPTPVTPTPVTPTPDTPTPVTPTPYVPVMPIAENEGESQVVEGGCQAYFGYRNENPFEVSIAIGDRNQFNFIYPSENVVLEPAEQVTNFLVGRQNGVFSVTWNSSTGENFIWSLDGHSAVARWCNPPE